MKKRFLSILWKWLWIASALCVVNFDIFDTAAAAKSSISKTNDNSKLISTQKNLYGKGGDKNIKAGDSDKHGTGIGGGDIIPIPDHLLNNDDAHHYTYEDENVDYLSQEYENYDDDYHHNSGKNK